jgi:hypothetical protein
MKRGIVLIALMAHTLLEGALPPFWQDVAEIKKILEDSKLDQYFESPMQIDAILRKDEGWEIQSEKKRVLVKVKPISQDFPGPQKFTLEFIEE